jgi:hypothetical protein
MAATFSLVELPNYNQKPFFYSIFCCPIAIGSTFIFKRPTNHNNTKHLVDQIIDARKAGKDDHKVTVNVFCPFKEWPPNTTLYPIKEGLGTDLHEVVLTSKTSKFHFDQDVYNIAFIFTTFKLSKHGAILQGINNVFICRSYDDKEEVKDGELIPFLSMI